ncbi:hypothetical protein CAPTEDRAFT_207735 [Capitella teleta]|uniref:Uncharacterized protein n=1 Tax=Capitella teleta TaxID=283909 RepID=R7TJC2_CAPTE|nr:hypothetical protein CAPTEDRAFT_207735 [Capitella teleta]|eukprot:ELT91205.1 hypothetical protein CAPTEDRAFT_207735 [Capitella teleta]
MTLFEMSCSYYSDQAFLLNQQHQSLTRRAFRLVTSATFGIQIKDGIKEFLVELCTVGSVNICLQFRARMCSPHKLKGTQKCPNQAVAQWGDVDDVFQDLQFLNQSISSYKCSGFSCMFTQIGSNAGRSISRSTQRQITLACLSDPNCFHIDSMHIKSHLTHTKLTMGKRSAKPKRSEGAAKTQHKTNDVADKCMKYLSDGAV